MTGARLRILQAVRLKGRATANDLAAATQLSDEVAMRLLAELTAVDHVVEARERFKLTPTGRAALNAHLAAERDAVDQAALTESYHEFNRYNTELKELMTRWQLKGGTTPNDHTDADYDAAVIAGLVRLDTGFQPLLSRIVALVARLEHYPPRFARALERITAGDHSWFARPLADSYHTVWFELHEDLIGLAGLTRTDEAAAGRAL